MEFTVFTAGKDDEGKRLDRVIKAILDGRAAPGMNIFQALRKRLVRLNGGKAEASVRIHERDRIEIASFLLAGTAGTEEKKTISPPLSRQPSPSEASLPAQPPSPAAPQPAQPIRSARSSTRLEILFQNDDIMFINKSAGISVQPSAGCDISISRIVKAAWEAAGPHGSLSFIPAPLHRLDRYTSGVLAISRSARGAAWFSRAIQERAIRKFYLGVCMGRLEEDAMWEDWLTAGGENGSSRGTGFHTVRQVEANEETDGEDVGVLARTQVHPVSYGRRGQAELTLVQYELLTGRKHQIRAQSALHGHPLYGDAAYGGHVRTTQGSRNGSPAASKRTRSGDGIPGGRFFLHALRLEFPPDNPLSLPEQIEAPLPEAFAAFIRLFSNQKLAKVPVCPYNERKGYEFIF